VTRLCKVLQYQAVGPYSMQLSKLKNLPVTAKIGIGWVIIISGGLFGFYLSKLHIDKTRYENMKLRERLRLSNQIEEYNPERNYKLVEIPVTKSKSE